MNEHHDDRAARAAQALAIRRERTQTLRLRVAAIAVAIFIAAWATIFVQLVEGKDPALSTNAAAAVSQTPSEDPSASDPVTSDPYAAEQQSAPSAVTTRQS